jgi:hypothetical protein
MVLVTAAAEKEARHRRKAAIERPSSAAFRDACRERRGDDASFAQGRRVAR